MKLTLLQTTHQAFTVRVLKLSVLACYLPVKHVVSIVKLPLEGFHLFSEISASFYFLAFGTILSFTKLNGDVCYLKADDDPRTFS